MFPLSSNILLGIVGRWPQVIKSKSNFENVQLIKEIT